MRKAKDLDGWRREIDRLDKKIVSILNQRARCAARIGLLKMKKSSHVRDAAREKQVLRNVAGLSRSPLSRGDLEAIYRVIIASCRKLQNRV